MLARPDPMVVLHVPHDLPQDNLLHNLRRHQGQANRPVVPWILPAALLVDGSHIGKSTRSADRWWKAARLSPPPVPSALLGESHFIFKFYCFEPVKNPQDCFQVYLLKLLFLIWRDSKSCLSTSKPGSVHLFLLSCFLFVCLFVCLFFRVGTIHSVTVFQDDRSIFCNRRQITATPLWL